MDLYGTQQPIALLKLLFEYGGFYDRDKDLNWKNLRDLNYMAAMGKAGGGRNVLDPRFLSMFSVFHVTFPSDNTIMNVFSSILNAHLEPFSPYIQQAVAPLIQITLDLYKLIINDLPPTPSKFHYIFNMRDLSRICQGLMMTNPNIYSQRMHFVRCWRNEFIRVISDRLICKEVKFFFNFGFQILIAVNNFLFSYRIMIMLMKI